MNSIEKENKREGEILQSMLIHSTSYILFERSQTIGNKVNFKVFMFSSFTLIPSILSWIITVVHYGLLNTNKTKKLTITNQWIIFA